jgi:NAD(P)-dependent dehydrogenase (short-subunit alcohol dehydrogenase family)
MNRLKGKVAIVTGGSVGIGRACVARMSEEGAKVAIFDVMDAEGIALAGDLAAKGRDVVFMSVDVSDEAAVASAVGAVAARFGRLDVLVNNAGISGGVAPVWWTVQALSASVGFALALSYSMGDLYPRAE